MPYYSYGYGYDSANLIYLILLVPVLLLSLYAQAAVSGNFSRYSKVTNRRGLTGAQAAAGVLRAHGITDVGIARCSGKLTDHYDPRNNTIFLSDSVYDAATVAAVGVAAHEAGHAVQYAVGYGPVKLRSAIVKTTQFSSQASFIILMLGLVLYSQPILLLGIVLFGVVAFFQLVTLPVEFNASHRALETLEGEHILEDEEMAGARKVLRAAALTYVAALLSSLLQLLRCGVHGQAHIGARVAVRHGENVEIVDALFFLGDRGRAEDQHLLENRPGNGIVHRKGSSSCLHGHAVDADIHAAHDRAGILGDKVTHLTDDGLADRRNVHAVLDDDVQLDGDLMVVVLRDVDALAHRLAAQQVDDAVRHGAVGHALHAEATRRRRAGDARERGVAHEDAALFVFQFYHIRASFLQSCVWKIVSVIA